MAQRTSRRFPFDDRTWPRLLLAAAILLYALYFSWMTVTRFAAFDARALDMGNLHQAVWNTAHGNWFQQTNQTGSTNRLSLHVEPILLPIAAYFRLFPHVEALLVLQATVVALGALPLYAIGEKRLHSPWLALALAVAWLLMPAIQAANLLEFHPLTLAPTFLMAAFYFLLERRAGWYALFALLAAASKEDMGLLVAMTGLYALVALRMRWTGLLTILLGVGWSLFAVLGIQQQFGGNIHWGRYAWMGETPAEMARALFARPGALWAQLQAADAGQYFFELLLPVGFLSLLAPEVLLLALPSIGINLLADFPAMHQVDGLIYAAPIAPFVALAAVMAAARALGWARRAEAGGVGRRWPLWAIGTLVLGGAIAAQALWGYLPGGGNSRFFEVTEHDRRAAAIMAQIAPDDRVSAQDRLNPHVAGRETVYIFPELSNLDAPPANTVLVDVTGPSWPIHPSDVHSRVTSLLESGWGIVAADDGYLLVREGETNQTMPADFYTAWQGASTPASTPIHARFGDSLDLSGVDVASDKNGEVVVRLDLRSLKEHESPLNLRLIARNAGGERLYDSLYNAPVAALWYPSTMWPVGETVSLASLPWTPAEDRFTLYVGVYAGDDAEGGRLPVESHTESARVLEEGKVLRIGAYERGKDGWRPADPATPSLSALHAVLGGSIGLVGGAIEVGATDPATATVTLGWMAEETPKVDYNVFIHVLDAAGERVAQYDGPPFDALGPLPTTQWRRREPIQGDYAIPLPQGLPAGSYEVVAGLYDWRTGERLPASGPDARPDSSFAVGLFTVP